MHLQEFWLVVLLWLSLGTFERQVGPVTAVLRTFERQVGLGTTVLRTFERQVGPGLAVFGTFERQVGPGPVVLGTFERQVGPGPAVLGPLDGLGHWSGGLLERKDLFRALHDPKPWPETFG